jgi:sulfonate transport system ATP-binding protein
MPWKRVWENVALGLPGAGAREKAEQALREVELPHRIDAWPLTLSGGEAQRAGLARALVRDPDLLLLDEPFASLDALTRLRMQGLVANLWKRHGMSALLVTHDVDEALLLADHAVVLQNGRIGQQLRIDLPRPRRHADPHFAALRSELLRALGLTEDLAA